MADKSSRILVRPARRVIIHRGPGKLTLKADDISVDQIPNASEWLSTGREERASVEHHQGIDPRFDHPPEQHRNDQKKGT